MMIIIWIYSILVSLMPVFGWNRYCYRALLYTGSLDRSSETGFPLHILITEFFVPIIVLIVCYIRILIQLKKNSDRMRAISSLKDENSAL